MTIVTRDSDIQIEKLSLGSFGTNTYTIICMKTMKSAVVDAPGEAGVIIEKLKDTSPQYILLTHNHMDHLGALAELHSSLNAPIAAHAADSNLPVRPQISLNDGDKLPLGELTIEVLHTPGHTPGGLCFRVGKYLMSGDTIFTAGPGKTRSPEAFKQVVKSITEKIFILPEDTEIHPGHGDSTTLTKEKEEYAVFATRKHDPNICGDIIWLKS
ncbi:MBL fold metallo-hydrolase [Chloroflexota bacterium]